MESDPGETAAPVGTAALMRGTGQEKAMQWYTRLQERLKALYEAYGQIAIWTYLILWLSVLAAYSAAIHMGVEIEGAGTEFDQEGKGLAAGIWRWMSGLLGPWAAVIFGAWIAVKATQPVRIIITLALTPVIARFLRREPSSVPQE